MPSRIDGTPVRHWTSVGRTTRFSLSGHPAVSVPAGMVGVAPTGFKSPEGATPTSKS